MPIYAKTQYMVYFLAWVRRGGLPRLSLVPASRTRKDSNVPIIILSAKDTEVDTVLGLELGADDYLIKPFRLARSTRRRQRGLPSS